MRSTGIRLLTLSLGCGVSGWVLMSYGASFAVWLLMEAMMLYLAWSGTGAIALSVVGALGILWSATLFHQEAEFLVELGLPFAPAQYWATELLLNWLLAMTLIFRIAVTHQWLCRHGWQRTQTFCLLAIATNLGLSLVQLVRVLL